MAIFLFRSEHGSAWNTASPDAATIAEDEPAVAIADELCAMEAPANAAVSAMATLAFFTVLRMLNPH
ncbi:hypothetical protein ACFQ6E_20315 [Streptomyces sp. NPDC056462]|uniref:hypothetical protein n=1 Tax=Streptomyces sp. NPDC056462 TaxID=3345826 RepID=UPI00368FC5C3